jgi:hypothetical protein
MKKSELKSIIKECIKEIIFEEGILSNLVSEVACGIADAQNKTLLSEHNRTATKNAANSERERKDLLETKRKMINAIGSEKMKDVFSGTDPLPNNAPSQGSPMSGRDPKDAGVDISKLFKSSGEKWRHLK